MPQLHVKSTQLSPYLTRKPCIHHLITFTNSATLMKLSPYNLSLASSMGRAIFDQWCESVLSPSSSSPFLTRVQAPRPRKKDSRGHLSNWEKKRTPHLSFSHSHSHPGLPAADSTSFLCRTTQKKPRLTTPAKSARSIKSSNKFQSETAVKLPNSTAEIELF